MNILEILVYLTIGFVAGVALSAIFVKLAVNERLARPRPATITKGGSKVASFALVAAFVAVVAFGSAVPTLAQATPVPLEVPTDVIFTETNNWLATFAPLAAIGTGISIAIAVLGYIGKMIISAFK